MIEILVLQMVGNSCLCINSHKDFLGRIAFQLDELPMDGKERWYHLQPRDEPEVDDVTVTCVYGICI